MTEYNSALPMPDLSGSGEYNDSLAPGGRGSAPESAVGARSVRTVKNP